MAKTATKTATPADKPVPTAKPKTQKKPVETAPVEVDNPHPEAPKPVAKKDKSTVSLSIGKDDLKKIVFHAKPTDREHMRDMSEGLMVKFFELPADKQTAGEGVDANDHFVDNCEPRTDINKVFFQCGRNPEDGFALIELDRWYVEEYHDEHDKPCNEFYFLLVLGQVLKTNVQEVVAPLPKSA